MKYLIIALLLLPYSISHSSSLNNLEMNKIQNEINSELASLIEGCHELDLEKIFRPFSKDPDFYMIAADGKSYSYQEFYNNNKSYFDNLSAFRITTIKKDITVLSSDYVLVSWIYSVVATGKEGWQDIMDSAGATFLFKKVGSDWKVVKYQESTATPQRVDKT